jgi:hypothetical protein
MLDYLMSQNVMAKYLTAAGTSDDEVLHLINAEVCQIIWIGYRNKLSKSFLNYHISESPDTQISSC